MINMKDYYQILRIGRGASAAEIRRAYRVLVQKLHPDVNPDPAAHELIKDVNEAYDVLGDAVKKQAYDYGLENPYITVGVPQEPAHRDPAYKRRGFYRPPTVSDTSQLDIMKRYLHVVTKVAWIGCVLCMVLAVDFGVPHRVIPDDVKTFRLPGNRRANHFFLITQANRSLKISDRDLEIFEVGQKIDIIESGLFSILVAVRVPEKQVSVTNLNTVYRNYFFVLILLFALSIIALVPKGTIEFKFNIGIVNFFVLIFVLILLLK